MKIFDTVADLAAASLAPGQFVETYGELVKGDGNAAKYYVEVASYTPITGDVVLANGNVARKQLSFEQSAGSASETINDSLIEAESTADALNQIIVNAFLEPNTSIIRLERADSTFIDIDVSGLNEAEDTTIFNYQSQGLQGVGEAAPPGDPTYRNLVGVRTNGQALPTVDLTPAFNNTSATELLDITDPGSGQIITDTERTNYDAAVDGILISGIISGGGNNLQLLLNGGDIINIDVSTLNTTAQDAKHLGVYLDLPSLQAAHTTPPEGSTATVTNPDGNLYRYDGLAWVDTGTGFLGDMLEAVYDPTAVAGDAFSQDNMADGLTNKNYTAAEQTKLAGIESGATEDQTGAEIKALYELEPSAFTDSQFTKLGGIETNADVTDEANVTSSLNGATPGDITPTLADRILLQDDDDSRNLKTVLVSALKTLLGTFDGDSLAAYVANGDIDITGSNDINHRVPVGGQIRHYADTHHFWTANGLIQTVLTIGASEVNWQTDVDQRFSTIGGGDLYLDADGELLGTKDPISPLGLATKQYAESVASTVGPDTNILFSEVTTNTTSVLPSRVVLDTMTVTPPAGTYLFTFSCAFTNSNNNNTVEFTIVSGGVDVGGATRSPTTTANKVDSTMIQAIVTVNGAETVEVEWGTTGNTASTFERQLTYMRVS
jgi:hypothetical protein